MFALVEKKSGIVAGLFIDAEAAMERAMDLVAEPCAFSYATRLSIAREVYLVRPAEPGDR